MKTKTLHERIMETLDPPKTQPYSMVRRSIIEPKLRALKSEVNKAEADTRRLEWWSIHGINISVRVEGNNWYFDGILMGTSFRKAIDKAMKVKRQTEAEHAAFIGEFKNKEDDADD